MKIFLIICILLFGNFVFADEPFGDYNFLCEASDGKTNSALQIDGGVDPSGGFSVSINGKGRWNSLNGISYIAISSSLKNGTKYVSAPYEKPKVTIKIFWNQLLAENEYRGTVQREGFNDGYPFEVICRTEFQ